MRIRFLVTGLIIVSIFLLGNFGGFDAVVLFLLAGAIPGTSYLVPSSVMLISTISLIWMLVIFVAYEQMVHKSKPITHKKRLTKSTKKTKKPSLSLAVATKKSKPVSPRPLAHIGRHNALGPQMKFR